MNPQDPTTPAVDPLDLGQPTPADDPLLAPDHVPQHALTDPAPAATPWPDSTLAPAAMSDAELMATAQTLTVTVAGLSTALDAERVARADAIEAEQQARAADKKSVFTWLKRGGGFIAFDVVVTVAGLVAGVLLYNAVQRIDVLVGQVQAAVHEQCSTDGILIASRSEAGRLRFVQGPVAYDVLYNGLEASAQRLHCAGVVYHPGGTPPGPAIAPTVTSPVPGLPR